MNSIIRFLSSGLPASANKLKSKNDSTYSIAGTKLKEGLLRLPLADRPEDKNGRSVYNEIILYYT